MAFQEKDKTIEWNVNFKSPVKKVYKFLSTDVGRGKFWAEKTKEENGFIEFTILNYPKYKAKIIQKIEEKLYRLEYFGTDVTITLKETDSNGTDLHLMAITPNEEVKTEMAAGWVSVLMAMKAAVDYNIDLRNHNPEKSWGNGYLDN